MTANNDGQQPARKPAPKPPKDSAQKAPSIVNLFAERRRRILTLPAADPRRQPALAICTLDEGTDPDLQNQLGHKKLAEAITRLTGFLIFRTMQRASWAGDRRAFEPHAAEDERFRKDAETVEAGFRKALVKAFPQKVKGAPLQIRAFEKAFAAFVAGELRMSHLFKLAADDPLYDHGVPDGPNHYAFAEAALLFIRLGINAKFWTTPLRSFVCSAQFFSANFWDRSTRTWNAYSCKNLTAVVTPSTAILSMLDQFHSAMDVAQQAQHFGDILGIALRDDEHISYPVPTPKEFQ